MTFLVIGLIVSVTAVAFYSVALSRVIRSDGYSEPRRSGITPPSHEPDEFTIRRWW